MRNLKLGVSFLVKIMYDGACMKKWKWIVILIILNIVLLGVLIYRGRIHINELLAKKYPIQGIDVSYYQGNIDWNLMQQQDVDFAFIKATEGSSHIDPKYYENWMGILQTDIKAGAYHFFSFESSGLDQALHYIQTVPITEGMLPPVIDVEFYGNYFSNKPDVETTRRELQHMLWMLEAHYGMKPIIYATDSSYSLYIRDAFSGYPLWIRNVYFSPNIGMPRKWTFWQYTSTAKMEGYDGHEKYIDRNVFVGDEGAWEQFCTQKEKK